MKTFVILKYCFSELDQKSFILNKRMQISDEKQFSFKKLEALTIFIHVFML